MQPDWMEKRHLLAVDLDVSRGTVLLFLYDYRSKCDDDD